MTDTTSPAASPAAPPAVTSADLSQPVTAAEFITRHGVEPGLAAQLAAAHNALAGRPGAVPAKVMAPPLNPTDSAGAANEVAAANEMTAHLDQLYSPPSSPMDYRIPPTSGTPTDEAFAADRALTQMLHGAGTPKEIGNALLSDIATNRTYTRPPEDTAALRPWVRQLLSQAQRVPELAPYARGISPEMLLERLSPETIVALRPFVQHRGPRR
jgi:hypothetical protein